MDFASDVLSIEVSGHVGTLWLDRPEKRNAMSHEMWSAFPDAIEALAANDDVRAVVLAARGKSFCVGIDLAGRPDEQVRLASEADGAVRLELRAWQLVGLQSR